MNNVDGQMPMEIEPESTVQQGQIGSYYNGSQSLTGDGSLTTAAYNSTISQNIPQDCDLDHSGSTVQPGQVWVSTNTDSNRNSHTEDASLTAATDPNTISQDCDLNHSDRDPDSSDLDSTLQPFRDEIRSLMNNVYDQSPMETQPESTVQQGQVRSYYSGMSLREDGSLTTASDHNTISQDIPQDCDLDHSGGIFGFCFCH
ncbi:uncharacterized protein [Montipora foliosa]|uniref:uncharacterized protein n=1 Tax=Montipora foliosa TaxID=591990 RepID=UPI0035F18919